MMTRQHTHQQEAGPRYLSQVFHSGEEVDAGLNYSTMTKKGKKIVKR
jgi:hypothetical protein